MFIIEFYVTDKIDEFSFILIANEYIILDERRFP